MKLLRLGTPGEERPAVLVDEHAAAVSQHVEDYGQELFAGGGSIVSAESWLSLGRSYRVQRLTCRPSP